ncbi:MAG TPA: TonB-dependent receptor, partial [Rhodothermales bacterium]|nr:TonB-dependent receptor [Rhodothermales bacterium]
LGLLIGFLPTRSALAQRADLEGVLPDTIVVTASRLPEDIRLSGRRVAVWTARDIADLPVSSVDELLRAVGGVEVQSRGGFGVQSDLTMRGSSFNGVLLLLDGVRVNDPMTGHFLADLPIPLSEIARIEVVRGPATVLYGPDAVGGVVQIFTYAGLRQAGLPPGTASGSAEVKRGRYGLNELGLAGRGGGRRTVLSAAGTWQGTDGMPIRDASGQVVATPSGPLRTDFRRGAATTALSQQVGKASLFARVGLDSRRFNAYHFYTPFPSDMARESTSTLWAQARLSGGGDGPGWRIDLAAKQHGDAYTYNPQTPANRHTSRMFTAQAQATKPVGGRLSVTVGSAAMLRSIESNSLGDHADGSGGAFALARWRLAPSLLVRAGGRVDYDPAYGLEPTPQLSIAFSRGVVSAYVNSGRTIRAPNYVERYYNTLLAHPTGNLGNPDLDVETAWAHEAGVSLYPTGGLSLHADVFTRRTWNLIDYARFDTADPIFLARNLHDVRVNGVEADADFVRSFRLGRTRLSASYALLDTQLDPPPAGVEFKYALTSARHLAQGMAAMDLGPASLGLQGLWKDPMLEEAYGVVNLQAGYHVDLGRQRLSLLGEVRNLLDRRYSDVFDAPMPGRWWIFGVRLER